jgi:hypothetical protein
MANKRGRVRWLGVMALVVMPASGGTLGAVVGLVYANLSSGKPAWPIPLSLSNFAAIWMLLTGVGLILMLVVVGARWTFRSLDSRRLGAVALVLVWPWGVAHRVRHSARLAAWLVARSVACLPSPYRAQYEAVWLGEVDWQRQQGRPLLGWAIGVAGTAVITRLELRTRLAGAAGRLRELPKSGPARVVRQAKPIWLGVLTAISVFCAAAAGWSGVEQHGPTRAQLLWAIAASVLAGGAVTWQVWPRGPAADEPAHADGSLDERASVGRPRARSDRVDD